MILNRGITGFILSGDPPLATTDERAFFSVCQTVALALNGNIESFEPPSKYREKSFSIATLKLADQSLSIILHANFPYVAFAQPILRDQTSISFVDYPEAELEFQRFADYTILTAEELGTPVWQVDLSNLGEAELEQIEYWKPETVGELVFNFWD